MKTSIVICLCLSVEGNMMQYSETSILLRRTQKAVDW
jgi:hypothetical protein